MNHFYRSLLLACACLIAIPYASQAAAAPGSLIKGSGPSVYYLGQDQKRYVFPTEATYKTWYADFSTVQTISDAELTTYPLGGNVTYRPGVRLVKITTDPKVYAVARGGMLRWIETEAIARALYGDQWARMVNDVPDAFFVNYRVTNSVHVVGDFSPTAERDTVTYIDMNRVQTPTPPPAPVTTPPVSTTPPPATPIASSATILLQTSPVAPAYGSSITVQAEAQPHSANLVKLFFDNVLQRSCEYYLCSMSLSLPFVSSQSTFTARAEARFSDGSMTSSTILIVPATGSRYISLQIPRNDLEPSSAREVIATATNGFTAHFFDIYLDGGVVQGCIDQQECRYTAPETSPIGTHHAIYIVATDANGQTFRSETRTLAVVANDSPVTGIMVGKTSILQGETVDVHVSAADNDGIQETRIMVDGTVVKTCSLPICDAIVGPWRETRTVEIVGSAKDSLGAQSFATSTTIAVR